MLKFLLIITTFLFSYFNCSAQLPTKTDTTTIAFLSDTQAPLFFEWITRKTNHNLTATKFIFSDIIKKHPSSLFILGDVVSLGYSNHQWKRIDRYLTACKQNNIPVYAALGNHEFYIHPKKGVSKFQSRFPLHSPTGYVTINDSVAIILLNSNFSKMTAADFTQQDKWYVQKLNQLNNDSAIKFIIVGCHHSPFTNSKAAKPDQLVQQKFVPPYLSSKKCVLFLSGHSHNLNVLISREKIPCNWWRRWTAPTASLQKRIYRFSSFL